MDNGFPQQPDRSALAQRIRRTEVLEHLGDIGAFTGCSVFVASVRNDSIAGLTGAIDDSMIVFGDRLPESPLGEPPCLRAVDLPILKRQVAAALAGHPPVPHDYHYSGASAGNTRRLRCLLMAVTPGDTPEGIQHPAVIGVAHLTPTDQAAPGQAADARLFTDVFERWIRASTDNRPIVEEVIRISAEAVGVVNAKCQLEVAALLSGRAAEQLRLASDIHDGICQQLATAAGILSVVARTADAGDAHRACTQLDLARRLVDEAMAESRSAISGLQPPALNDVALPVALRRLAEKAAPTAVLYLDIDEEVRLSESARGEVYRVAQEALANVHRHADAGIVEVSLMVVGGDVQLLVRDDGCGFSPGNEDSRGDGAFGLVSMKGRALTLGARLDIHSTPGSGTCVELRVPRATSS
ncbi:MAG: sensor histidine kinase [Pseudonocardiales bacterium]